MFEPQVYTTRRHSLKNLLHGGIILLPGNSDTPMNYPANTYPFRQDSTFLYFFGLDQPDLVGVIDLDNGEEIIFGNDVSIEDIIWMGPQPAMTERALKVGVNKVLPTDELSGFIQKARSQNRTIHFLPPYRHETRKLIESLLGIPAAEQKQRASVDLIKAVVKLRSIKEPCEIEELEKAAAIGFEMHFTAMKMAKPGVAEREIAGRIEGIALSKGSGVSFPVILSQNGEILHNHDHSQILQEGRLMIVDAGAESLLHYACDFTRTVPVGGKFSSRQRDIYQIVLDANNTATAHARPGVTYQSIHLMACRVIASGLRDLGLMKGDVEEAVNQGAHALFFPHGLGHMMGLDVHDMENLGEDFVGYDEETSRIRQFGSAYLRFARKLQPGFVITNEPGIYFIPELIRLWRQENRFSDFINYDKVEEYIGFGGIRLEDDLLITETGCRLLGKRIPVSIDEVEETMRD